VWTRICVHAKFLEWIFRKSLLNKSTSLEWKYDFANMWRFLFIIGRPVAHIKRWVWEIWITCKGLLWDVEHKSRDTRWRIRKFPTWGGRGVASPHPYFRNTVWPPSENFAFSFCIVLLKRLWTTLEPPQISSEVIHIFFHIKAKFMCKCAK